MIGRTCSLRVLVRAWRLRCLIIVRPRYQVQSLCLQFCFLASTSLDMNMHEEMEEKSNKLIIKQDLALESNNEGMRIISVRSYISGYLSGYISYQ